MVSELLFVMVMCLTYCCVEGSGMTRPPSWSTPLTRRRDGIWTASGGPSAGNGFPEPSRRPSPAARGRRRGRRAHVRERERSFSQVSQSVGNIAGLFTQMLVGWSGSRQGQGVVAEVRLRPAPQLSARDCHRRADRQHFCSPRFASGDNSWSPVPLTRFKQYRECRKASQGFSHHPPANLSPRGERSQQVS